VDAALTEPAAVAFLLIILALARAFGDVGKTPALVFLIL
jgi:hypothetical protein